MKKIEDLQRFFSEGVDIVRAYTKNKSKKNEKIYVSWLAEWNAHGKQALKDLDEAQRERFMSLFRMVVSLYEAARPTLRTIDSKEFGRLIRDKEASTWTTATKIGEYEVVLAFDDLVNDTLPAAAVTSVKGLDQLLKRMEETIVEELLRSYNDNWRISSEEDHPILSGDEFIRHLQLESVHVWPSGEMLIYWNDGESKLFGGHYIQVAATPDGSITEVKLSG